MCKFCEPTEKEKKEFHEWENANPYVDEDACIEDGVQYILEDNTFSVVFRADSGYLGDSVDLEFAYCPMCGRWL